MTIIPLHLTLSTLRLSEKGGAFAVDLAGKSELGGSAPLQSTCHHGGVISSSSRSVVGYRI